MESDGPAPWENDFEGYEGIRVDVVSHRDLEIGDDSRGDREPPPEPPEGAPAANANLLVEIRTAGTPTGAEADEYCSLRETSTKSGCDVEVHDAYQLPSSRGNFGYPLGEDGAASLFIPPDTEYEIRVRGQPLEQQPDCREYYRSGPDHAIPEPATLKQQYDIIVASEDHVVRIGYDVVCGTWVDS